MGKKQWEIEIKEWEKTEYSQAKWCRLKGLAPKQFSYWKRRFQSSQDSTIQFKKLTNKNVDSFKVEEEKSLVIQIGFAKVEVFENTSSELLKLVLMVLKTC